MVIYRGNNAGYTADVDDVVCGEEGVILLVEEFHTATVEQDSADFITGEALWPEEGRNEFGVLSEVGLKFVISTAVVIPKDEFDILAI